MFQANRDMDFLKGDIMRSFGIGFALGCVVLLVAAGFSGQPSGVVPAAVAATAR